MTSQWLEKTPSTNTWLKENIGSVASMTMVCAKDQTAGRGQRGNSWEAQPGKNLTFSFWFQPEGIRPAEQFVISEAVALAVVFALRRYGIEARVKWPNDIYAGDRKICGILIENSILPESISSSIVGIGLNVNQKEFLSDAPNPVSMTLLAGEEFSLEEVAYGIGEELEKFLNMINERDELHRLYMSSLWRSEGAFPYKEAATGRKFFGRIEDVESSGHLIITDSKSGESRRYAFKEVVFVL